MKREATSPLERAQALIDAGDAPFAVALLRSQLAAGRGGILTRVTLGRALVKSGELAEALAVFREAALLFPRLAEAALALGEALMAAGHIPTAIAEFQRALNSTRPRRRPVMRWDAPGSKPERRRGRGILRDSNRDGRRSVPQPRSPHSCAMRKT